MYLRTLGTLQLLESNFQKAKPLLLLSYLAVEGVKSRRHLAELFWPTAADSMNSLAKALSQLRSAGEIVSSDDKQAWTDIPSDVKALLEGLEAGDTQKVLSLYQFPFLQDFYLASCGEELEEWIYVTREYLAERIRQLRLELAEQEIRVGHFEEALAHAEQAYQTPGAAEAEPETLKRLYTVLQSGGSPLARQVRHEAESFGLSFAPEAPSQKAHPLEIPNNLLHRGTAYIGRELEIAELNGLIANAGCRLLTLFGQGGTGKTRLALQVAFQQLALGRFKDGVFFVALESLSSAEQIPGKVAETLGLRLQGQEPATAQLTTYLQPKHILLVFDNFEHLMPGTSVLAELLARCPHLSFLVTSREALHLEEEWLFSVEGLLYPHDPGSSLEKALEFDAIRLFDERARRARKGFELSPQDLEALIRFCRLVQGSPLALELAAWWIRALPLSDILQELQTNLDLLRVPTANLPERQQSLRASFDYSWHLLDSEQQQVLCKLSVFQGGFTRQAAQLVAGATIPVLVSLVDKSLILAQNTRFDLHPLLKQYLAEKLSASPEAATTLTRHRLAFARVLESCARQLAENHSLEALQHFERDQANILLAWETMLQEDIALCVAAARTFADIYFLRGSGQDVVTLCSTALAQLERSSQGSIEEQRLMGYLLLYQAAAHFYLGEHSLTRHLLERCLSLFQPLQEHKAIMRALNLLGGIEKYAGRYKQAETYYQQALGLAEQENDNPILYLNNLGHIALDSGRYEEARDYYQRSLSLSKREVQQTSALQNLGLAHLRLGDVAKAQELMESSLAIAQKHGFEGQLPYTLGSLCDLAMAQGDYEKAETCCLQGLHYARKQADRLQESTLLTRRARVAMARADIEARAFALESLSLLKKIRDVPGTLEAMLTFAQLEPASALTQRIARTVATHAASSFLSRTQARALFNAPAEDLESHEDLGPLLEDLLKFSSA